MEVSTEIDDTAVLSFVGRMRFDAMGMMVNLNV